MKKEKEFFTKLRFMLLARRMGIGRISVKMQKLSFSVPQVYAVPQCMFYLSLVPIPGVNIFRFEEGDLFELYCAREVNCWFAGLNFLRSLLDFDELQKQINIDLEFLQEEDRQNCRVFFLKKDVTLSESDISIIKETANWIPNVVTVLFLGQENRAFLVEKKPESEWDAISSLYLSLLKELYNPVKQDLGEAGIPDGHSDQIWIKVDKVTSSTVELLLNMEGIWSVFYKAPYLVIISKYCYFKEGLLEDVFELLRQQGNIKEEVVEEDVEEEVNLLEFFGGLVGGMATQLPNVSKFFVLSGDGRKGEHEDCFIGLFPVKEKPAVLTNVETFVDKAKYQILMETGEGPVLHSTPQGKWEEVLNLAKSVKLDKEAFFAKGYEILYLYRLGPQDKLWECLLGCRKGEFFRGSALSGTNLPLEFCIKSPFLMIFFTTRDGGVGDGRLRVDIVVGVGDTKTHFFLHEYQIVSRWQLKCRLGYDLSPQPGKNLTTVGECLLRMAVESKSVKYCTFSPGAGGDNPSVCMLFPGVEKKVNFEKIKWVVDNAVTIILKGLREINLC